MRTILITLYLFVALASVKAGIPYANSLTNSSTIWVDPNGNDVWPGTFDRPFKTVPAALAVAPAGYTVKMYPGTWSVTNPWVVPPSVILRGSGEQSTIVKNYADATVVGVAILAGNRSGIWDMQITNVLQATLFQAGIGAVAVAPVAQPAYLNATFGNLLIYGDSDCFDVNVGQDCSWTSYNLDLRSKWDAMVVLSTTPGVTVSFTNYGGRLLARGPSILQPAQLTHAFDSGVDTLNATFIGTVFDAAGGAGSPEYAILPSSGPNGDSLGTINFIGCSVANGVYDPSGFVDGTITISGPFDSKLPRPLTNSSGFYTSGTGKFTGNGGGLTNVPGPTITQTNFVSGQLYQNTSGRAQAANCTVVLTLAAVTGSATLEGRIGVAGTTTNYVSQATGAAVITGSDKQFIAIDIPIGASYTFTNTSSGAGNAATISGGQLKTY